MLVLGLELVLVVTTTYVFEHWVVFKEGERSFQNRN